MNDIYGLGFDTSLNKPTQGTSTGVVYDSVNDTTNVGSILSGGQLTLKSLSIGGLVRQVAPGDDIQAAIDSVNREGGGTVQLLGKQYLLTTQLELKQNVNLVGAGKDITILDFQGLSANIFITGTVNLISENFSISNLTVQNSGLAAGIDINFCDFWKIENVRVTSCNNAGLRILHSTKYQIINGRFDNNTGDGITLGDTTTTRLMEKFSLKDCLSDTNGGNGFTIVSSTISSVGIRQASFINCHAVSNTGDGFNSTGALALDSSFVNCLADSNSGDGYDISTAASAFLGCSAESNSVNGFKITIGGSQNRLLGCYSSANTSDNYSIGDLTDTILIGCIDTNTTFTSKKTISNQSQSTVIGNTYAWEPEIFEHVYMKNTSGGDLPSGAVVVLKSVSTGNEVTTTTINGDNKVWGKAAASIQSNVGGQIMKKGKTTDLYVSNGTSSIVIGDYLSTYSHAYYAKKAISGDTAFAIALSTPTTSTAAISALLVSPRLI